MNQCPGCDKPMIDGQVFNGLLKCHWDCTESAREFLGQDNADAIIQMRINKRLAMDGIISSHPLFERLGGKL
ncbi:hypothetical protein vB_PsyM_KIL3b_0142 [Pseudomonas phage vB_PsyM_KIL3b]|uniref:Uncharacterized protein n=6 Tax=Flaumdravirus TaxID=2560133 RepID=A0A142IE94_9CAUD|nr:hypothetical protein BH774_gp061 [Pseudomonas phage vB_PsyM_KIL1]YP_009616828.1 hypothetical protein FDI83_gp062 [Pseudomonas phage vB_PsyM_KIL4]AMR57549.1 hypothetical protein vB_PsyM_KIL2_0149 [Pseudomonas phage vB_PsyM_KIL2]AMR57709.1 hypothetical protein vB_PsyM_KIL3_0142 [Pseudomonas phage vB_PsyM_KIL3]AMR58044.1 hypothetical protein vB_PsyM_KIL5_0153 [Pseudomonas phage vB_PsyM_KIL5]AMR58207.1 hypothetical protein vB_PsyM_KIL3b_0142 [Pseudomonas phage vB_PsyM_KIL3b]AMR57388.1 hypothet